MYSLSRLKTAAAVAAAAGVSSSLASAAVLAINFMGGTYSTPNGQVVSQTAFGVSDSDWFNSSESSGPVNLNLSGVDFTWTFSNEWSQSSTFNSTGATGEDEVYFGYLDDGGSGADITISGLSAWLSSNGQTGYNVTIIMSTGQGGSPSFRAPTLFTASGGTNLGTFTIGNIEPAHSGGGVGIQGFGSLNGLTSDTLFVDGQTRSGDARGSIAGIDRGDHHYFRAGTIDDAARGLRCVGIVAPPPHAIRQIVFLQARRERSFSGRAFCVFGGSIWSRTTGDSE